MKKYILNKTCLLIRYKTADNNFREIFLIEYISGCNFLMTTKKLNINKTLSVI